MYCQYCGMNNDEESGNCLICNRPLNRDFKPDETKIYLDLARFSLKDILIDLFKNFNLLTPITIPIICIIYLVKKMCRKPFPSIVYLGKESRLHQINIGSIDTINKKKLVSTENALIRCGFNHLLDYEDKSRAQAICESLYINRSFGAYAKIVISRQTGKILYVILTAITSQKKVVEYANAAGIGEEQDNNITIKYFPGKTIPQLWQIFKSDLTETSEHRLCPETNFLLPVFYRIKIHSIDIGVKNGVLLENYISKEIAFISICYNHRNAIAVRKCAVCKVAICEACMREIDGSFYCTKCAPAETTSRILKTPWGYAGAAVRFCAAIIDMLITVMVITSVYFSLQFLFEFINAPYPSLISFITVQPLAILFLFWYYIVRVARKGQTIGKSLSGLRIISSKGSSPGFATAIIRFLTAIISLIFIIPIAAYLIIPFHKKKRGFHDKLSGSLVVTKNPGRKAVYAWIVTASLLIPVGVTGAVFVKALFNPGKYVMTSEIGLPANWERSRDNAAEMWKMTIREKEMGILIFDSTSITWLDMWNGDTIWRNNNVQNPRSIVYDSTMSLFIYEKIDTNKYDILRIDVSDGSVIWRQNLASSDDYWRFLTDSLFIVAYTTEQIFVFDHNGNKLWEKKTGIQKSDKYYDCYAEIEKNNLGIKISEDDSVVKNSAFNIQNGEEIHSFKAQDESYTLINLGCGYQGIIKDERFFEVKSDSSDTVVFYLKDSMDFIEYCSCDSVNNGSIKMLFYGRQRAYSADGSIAFEYPGSSLLRTITSRHLILSEDFFNKQTAAHIPELLLVDKFSGEVVKTIEDSIYTTISFLYENEHEFLLRADAESSMSRKLNRSFFLLSFLFNPQVFSTKSCILIINKSDFSVKKYTLGKNIGLIIPSPTFGEVFIKGIDRIGAYKLENGK